MDIKQPFIFYSKIHHSRIEPVKNQFKYKNWSLVFDLENLASLSIPFLFGVDRFGLLSFKNKDHGYRKKDKPCLNFLKDIAEKSKISLDNTQILMATMPRVFGYIFNPVSFWFILKKNTQNILAVLCEVNNTFGQTHSYVCLPNKGDYIRKDMILKAEKSFHVSPFMPRNGYYTFKFLFENENLGIWINYYSDDFKKPFVTSMVGELEPYNAKNLLKAIFKHSHITLRAIFLIHYQALKLFWKKVKFYKIPLKKIENVTFTGSNKQKLCMKK